MDRKRVWMVAGMCTAVVALMLVSSPQAWASAEAENATAEPSAVDPDAEVLLDECVADQEGVQVAEGLIIGGSCLPSTPLSCAQLPVPQGGSCSCQSQLEPARCKACDGSFKGQVLKTTCTIRPAPCQGICDLQPVTTRVGYSCTPS